MADHARSSAFIQFDVFTTRPLEGNPLAVVHDASGLSDSEMQSIAREMNLSETTFILPATLGSNANAAYGCGFSPCRKNYPSLGTPPLALHSSFGATRLRGRSISISTWELSP